MVFLAGAYPVRGVPSVLRDVTEEETRAAVGDLPAEAAESGGEVPAELGCLGVTSPVIIGVFEGRDGGDLCGQADHPRGSDGAERLELVGARAEISHAHPAQRVCLGHRFADDDVFALSRKPLERLLPARVIDVSLIDPHPGIHRGQPEHALEFLPVNVSPGGTVRVNQNHEVVVLLQSGCERGQIEIVMVCPAQIQPVHPAADHLFQHVGVFPVGWIEQ